MSLEEVLQGRSAEALVIGDQLDDTSEVGEQVSLVAVGQNGGHSRGVKFNVLVVDLDKMNVRVGLDHGQQSSLDSC